MLRLLQSLSVVSKNNRIQLYNNNIETEFLKLWTHCEEPVMYVQFNVPNTNRNEELEIKIK